MGFGVRVGPRIARVHVGSRGVGVSSGVGPFSAYAGTRRRSGSGSGFWWATFGVLLLIGLVIRYWWVVLSAIGVVLLIVVTVRLVRRARVSRPVVELDRRPRGAGAPSARRPAFVTGAPPAHALQGTPQQQESVHVMPVAAPQLAPQPTPGPFEPWTGQQPPIQGPPPLNWSAQPAPPTAGPHTTREQRTDKPKNDVAWSAREAQRRTAWRTTHPARFVAPRRLRPVSVLLWVFTFILLVAAQDVVRGVHVPSSLVALSLAASASAWGVYLWRGIPSERSAAVEDLVAPRRRPFSAPRRSRTTATLMWLLAVVAMTGIVGITDPGARGAVNVYLGSCFVILGLLLIATGVYLWRGPLIPPRSPHRDVDPAVTPATRTVDI